jgi:hypothetical protein
MSLNSNHPDLEPLIEVHTSAAKNGRTRVNSKKAKASGLILRRRDHKGYQEKCGRARLLALLGAFGILLIYLSNLKPYQHLVVKIPDDDKGKKSFLKIFLHVSFVEIVVL